MEPTTMVAHLYASWHRASDEFLASFTAHETAASERALDAAERVTADLGDRVHDLGDKIMAAPPATLADIALMLTVAAFDLRQDYPAGKRPKQPLERAVMAIAAAAERLAAA
jgi:hypothetical protein